MNVLDLGYFNSIQALQMTKKMGSIQELIGAVVESYEELDRTKLDNIFVTLMGVMEQRLLSKGGNDYSLPHLRKAPRRAAGESLVTLQCNLDAVVTGCLARYEDVLTELFC